MESEANDDSIADQIPLETEECTSTRRLACIDGMIERIAAEDDETLFGCRHKSEADLTSEEKTDFCRTLFANDLPKFLARYHRLLKAEDLECFGDVDDEVARNYMRKIAQRLSGSTAEWNADGELVSDSRTKCNRVTRNRRYVALQRLIGDGAYFSDDNMRSREPQLYQEMVGKHLTRREYELFFHNGASGSDMRLSKLLLEFSDNVELRRPPTEEGSIEMSSSGMQNQALAESRLQRGLSQVDKPRQDGTRRDSVGFDESELESSDEESAVFYSFFDAQRTTSNTISDSDKAVLREDFMKLMYQSFLDGKDNDFDYNTVDHDERLDDCEQSDRDAEDAYFDSEEPS